MQEEIVDQSVSGTQSANTKERIKAAAAEKIREGKEKAREFHHTAEDYVRAHPTKCVLGALGAGLVLGLIMRR